MPDQFSVLVSGTCNRDDLVYQSLILQGSFYIFFPRLRLIAENVAGQSDPSAPTREFQTIQAPPSGPPQEVTVRAVNETAIRATWKVCARDDVW